MPLELRMLDVVALEIEDGRSAPASSRMSTTKLLTP
jgi:hypothetical protein